MEKYLTKRNIIITGIVLIAAASRVAAHFLGYGMNFSPIMAIALFSGAYFEDRRTAFVVPIISMLLSDIFIGFHATMWAVYAGFALAVFIGRYLNNNISAVKVLGASLAGSIAFFVITNFAYWISYNPISIAGFTKTYIDAIPFFRNSIAGDLVYTAALFGSFELAGRLVPKLVKAK